MNCSLCFETRIAVSPRKRECMESIHLYLRGMQEAGGGKNAVAGRVEWRWDHVVQPLGSGYLTSKDFWICINFPSSSQKCSSDCRAPMWFWGENSPSWPLQRPSDAILMQTMIQIFFLTDKRKCWSRAGLLYEFVSPVSLISTILDLSVCYGLSWFMQTSPLTFTFVVTIFLGFVCISVCWWWVPSAAYGCWSMVSAQKPPWRIR